MILASRTQEVPTVTFLCAAPSVSGSRPGTEYVLHQYLLDEEMEEDHQGLSRVGENFSTEPGRRSSCRAPRRKGLLRMGVALSQRLG